MTRYSGTCHLLWFSSPPVENAPAEPVAYDFDELAPDAASAPARTSPSALAQDRIPYVRVKGVDPLQQERMVLDYVSAYGSINRSQAALLCQTTPVQARATLKRLVDDRRLTLQGERRGARYVLTDSQGC